MPAWVGRREGVPVRKSSVEPRHAEDEDVDQQDQDGQEEEATARMHGP